MRVGLVPLTRQPAGSVLIQASAPGLVPAAVLSETEVELLRRFVEEGSTAVVVTHFPTLVLEELGIGYDWEALPRLDRGGSRWREAAPVLPGPVTVGEPLAIQGRGGLEPSTLDDVLYAALGVPVVTERSVGEGSLVVVSDPWILSNAGLRHGGNLEFWVRLVDDRLRPGGLVLFDDLHAGATDGKGVVAYARRAGVLPAILLVLVALGLYGWRAGSRFGAVLPGVDARNPRASAELVHAVAGLYERADLRGHALAVLSRRFRRNLERRSGQAWDRGGLGPWVASELGPDAARQFARIKRGFGALLTVHLPDRDETLELARLVHDFEAQWLRPGRRTDDTKGA